MRIGIVGLGRMGANIARRLKGGGHDAVVYDRDRQVTAALVSEGFTGASDMADLVQMLVPPRAIWLMLPAGQITESTVASLANMLAPGDIVIDGGNSFWKDDIRRSAELSQRGIHYVDVGTSGGVWGRERGYCLMVGGAGAAFDHLEPVFETLAPGPGSIPRTASRKGPLATPEKGYVHAGGAGAGHFVKMVHNGIEYGMMQAFAEGFDILNKADAPHLPEDQRLPLDAAAVAEVWRRGSVISSWLLDLIAASLADDPELAGYSGQVQDSGEGRWVLAAAIDEEVAAPVMSAALFTRYRSRQDNTFGEKLLSAMRKQFGGHVEKQG